MHSTVRGLRYICIFFSKEIILVSMMPPVSNSYD